MRRCALRDERLLLEDIRLRSSRIPENLERFTREQIESDPNLYEATLRHLEIIGEAAKNLSAEFKAKHSEIPWRQVGRTGDILAHVYFGVSADRVWDIVSNHIPRLAEFVANELEGAELADNHAPAEGSDQSFSCSGPSGIPSALYHANIPTLRYDSTFGTGMNRARTTPGTYRNPAYQMARPGDRAVEVAIPNTNVATPATRRPML